MPPARRRAVCRRTPPPARRTWSTTGGTCSGAAAPGRRTAGRRGWAPWRRRSPSCGFGLRAAAELLHELGERRAHTGHALSLREPAGLGARDDDIVRTGRQALGLRPEGLPGHALHPRAIDRAAHAAGHRQAEPRAVVLERRASLARERVEHEEAVRLRPALAVDPLELRAARQAPAPRGPPATRALRHGQTVSRLRPLSRRRLSTTRPARVAMRARKPCVRARLRFLGW